MIHRVRETPMRRRTRLIDGSRGHLAEFGLAARARARRIGILTALIEDETDARIPPVARRALLHLVAELRAVQEEIARMDHDLARLADDIEACPRLMTTPGAGVITATAAVASTESAGRFQVGPSCRRLAGSRAETAFDRRRGQVRRDRQAWGRLSAPASRSPKADP